VADPDRDPAGAERPPAQTRTQALARAADTGEEERYGPLALARYEKDDGRSLILYSRAET
jgi:hypothetical protein